MIFGRHQREFAQAIRAGEWERTPEGIVFPRQRALLAGEFVANGVRARNLLTDYALGLLRDGVTNSGPAAMASLTVAIWGNNATPTGQWNDYDLAVIAGEYGDAPEGYTEANRPNWTPADMGARLTDNSGAPAAFTIDTATQLPVYGFAICAGSNTKRAGLSNAAPFDPTVVVTAIPDLDEVTVYGRHIVTDGGMNDWYDPSGDDHFDSFLGHWVDGNSDDVTLTFTTTVFAIARTLGAPTLYNNADVVDVTYGLQLT